jgi:protein gp37
MSENSRIEWTDATFNPWRGCQRVSPACEHCYAETLSKRNPAVLGSWGPAGTRVIASASYWREPLKWNAKAEAEGRRLRVFCLSLGDFFEDWRGPIHGVKGERRYTYVDVNASAIDGSIGATLDDLRAEAWDLISRTPHLDWLILTKRPENIARMLPKAWGDGWPNVWLGTTVEDQRRANERVPELLAVPAAVRFLSCEPLLGPVDLRRWLNVYGHIGPPCCVGGEGFHRFGKSRPQGPIPSQVDWVIAGGESGPGARPMHPAWARSLRDQCERAGVPFFFKQWGEFAEVDDEPRRGDLWHLGLNGGGIQVQTQPYQLGDQGAPAGRWSAHADALIRRVGKVKAGRLLDGIEWSEFPTPTRKAVTA